MSKDNKNIEVQEKPNSHSKLSNNPDKNLELLLRECKQYLKSYNEQKIRRAFVLCVDAHSNKLRKSGLAYYTHPLEVARIVVSEIPLDDTSVIAALLHDLIDKGDNYTLKDIRSEFGNDVADIVDGLHKIEHLESNHTSISAQAENYRKLLLSLFKDIRIILIKLADRLHNMRTLSYLDEQKRIDISKETLDIYVPFANRFGLRNIKWELEDLSFKFLNSKAYNEIQSELNATQDERDKYITYIIDPINKKLEQDKILKKLNIKYEIYGRAKHIYSIFNKMIARNKPMKDLYDLFAIRVLLDTDEPNMCFYAYGIVANLFPPVPETFKDYISSPKKNGYQSIHCAIIGIDKKIVELQIRTLKMHELAEKGFAAHFRYKSGKVDNQSILEKQHILDWIAEVREVFNNVKTGSNEEFVENFHNHLFFDEIYVYTPKNEFRTLPKDSTPLDFAYDIHSELGNNFISAKVNGKLVAIDYKLQSGDQIEIITSKKQMPSAEWINYVHTARAKQYIQKFLRDREKALEEEGRVIWLEKCRKNDVRLDDNAFEKLIRSVRFNSREEFYISIAKQELSVDKAFDFINLKRKSGSRIESSMKNVFLEHRKTVNFDKYQKKVEGGNIKYTFPKEIELEDDGSIRISINITVSNNSKILNQINTTVLSIDEIELIEINVNELETKFMVSYTISFSDTFFAEMLFDSLKLIEDIKEIEILKI